MTHGITMMQKLYAGSWDLELQVKHATFILSKFHLLPPSPTGALAYGVSRYDPGYGPVYLDDVGCTGSESSLDDCGRSNYGFVSTNCRSHFEDASVVCPTSTKLNH